MNNVDSTQNSTLTNNVENNDVAVSTKIEKPSPKVTAKKVGFLSVIVLVIGSAIGAGIFFKSGTVLGYTGNSLALSICAWVVAAIGVIAMALALTEIASARNDNLSIIGWCQTFAKRFYYKACKNFMFYIYTPLTYFFMPLYALMSFQDALHGFGAAANFGTANDWAIWMCFAILISAWFMIFSGISAKMGNVQNWIITSVKFIPLVAVALIGFIFAGQAANSPGVFPTKIPPFNPAGPVDNVWGNAKSADFFGISPVLGLFGSLAAIFFAFDGFYVVAGIQTEMRQPKKAPLAIVLGLASITVIYLIIAISMSILGNGSLYGLTAFFQQKPHLMILYGLLNLFISIGVLGIVNGFAMWAPRFIEDLIAAKELPFSERYLNKLNPSRPWVGIAYEAILSFPIVVIFCIIGGLGYIPTSSYWFEGSYYDGGKIMANKLTEFNSTAKLYSFCDLMANWTSLMAFTFIVIAIMGGLRNRKTKKVETVKSKSFVYMGIISSVIVLIGLFMQAIYPFINLFLLGRAIAQAQAAGTSVTDQIVGRVMLVIVFFIYTGMMVIPELFTKPYIRRYRAYSDYLKAKTLAAAGLSDNNKLRQLVDLFESKKIELNKQLEKYHNMENKCSEDEYQEKLLAKSSEILNVTQSYVDKINEKLSSTSVNQNNLVSLSQEDLKKVVIAIKKI